MTAAEAQSPPAKQKRKSKKSDKAEKSSKKRARLDEPPPTPLRPQSLETPAWLIEEGLNGALVQDTALTARDIGESQDVILLRVAPSHVGQLQGRRIRLPQASDEPGRLHDLTVTLDPSSSAQNMYLLGSEMGAVCATKVQAIYEASIALPDVEAEESDVDASLLEMPAEAEQQAGDQVPSEKKVKKDKKDKKKKKKRKDEA